jgi:serralysin
MESAATSLPQVLQASSGNYKPRQVFGLVEGCRPSSPAIVGRQASDLRNQEAVMSTVFRVILEGAQEVPPNNSMASGVGTVVFDSAAIAASYSFDIQGLDFGPITSGQTPTDLNDVNNTHFHSQVRGTSGPVVFGQITPAHDNDDLAIEPNADGSWSVSGRWETTDPASIANFSPILGDTFANVLDSAVVGSDVPIYFNVHTPPFPGGVIRGQLVAIADDIDDVTTGTTGNDQIDGRNGNDAILGLAGDDVLNGDNGNDVVDGGGGNDRLAGGNGRDTLDGSVGTDSLTGGNGEDSLDGGAGNDDLEGGNGKDTLNGGTGDDVLTGGNGPDQFVFNASFGDDVVTDFKNTDLIQFDDSLFQTPEAALTASEQVGEDTVITAGTSTVTLVGVQASSLQASDFSIVV